MSAESRRPTNRTHLIKLIDEAKVSDAASIARSKSLATIALCQMLVSMNSVASFAGVVKGETVIKLRLGKVGARISTDVDVVRNIEKAKSGRGNDSYRVWFDLLISALEAVARGNKLLQEIEEANYR